MSADISTLTAKGLISRDETKKATLRTDCPEAVKVCEKCSSMGSISEARYVQVNGSNVGQKVDCCDSDSMLELWCDNCEDHTKQIYVYARKCKVCNTGMNSGFMTGDYQYYCSWECEVKDCEANDLCDCHFINLEPQFINNELLKKENPIFQKWFRKLAEQDHVSSEVQVNTIEWLAFMDSNIGSDYFDKYFVEHWFYTEWEVEELVGDEVYDELGESYILNYQHLKIRGKYLSFTVGVFFFVPFFYFRLSLN